MDEWENLCKYNQCFFVFFISGSLNVIIHLLTFQLPISYKVVNPEIAYGDFLDITKAISCEAVGYKATVANSHSKTPPPSLRELRSKLATEGGLSAFEM
jgi:hypothetical protein